MSGNRLGIDPNKFKFLKSDDKCTTLQHKDGHVLTIAHNVMSPKNRETLMALGKSETEKPKKAEGGVVASMTNWYHEQAKKGTFGTGPQETERAEQLKSYTDKPQERPADAAEGATLKAKGGEVESDDVLASGSKKGISSQGETVRHASNDKKHAKTHMKHAKDEAQGRALFEREFVKPKLKGMAEGGSVGSGPSKGQDHNVDFAQYSRERDEADYAYSHGLPCLNPNCKSHGKPHPNCRCYSGTLAYARGGEVKDGSDQHFCHSKLAHLPNCDYHSEKMYAEGSQEPVSYSDSAPSFALAQEEPQESPVPESLRVNSEPALTEQQNLAPAPSQPESHQESPQQKIQDQELVNQAQQTVNPTNKVEASVELNPIQRFASYKQSSAQDILNHDAEWAQDLRNGHITPETYGSLFAKKDTLGKIGTMFGVLLSGVGSGLSHQPNAVLSMMKQTIDNDLSAQQKSKDNAQNYLRLGQAHILTQSQSKALDQETATKAYALANMRANRAALQHLVDMTSKLPLGSPQRAAAEANLAVLNNSVQNENFGIADRAATAASYYKMLGLNQDQPQQKQQPEAQLQQKQKAMMMLGPEGEKIANYTAEHHYPGLPGQSTETLDKNDKERLRSGIEFDQKLHRFMDWTKNHSGDLNPADREFGQTLAAELQGAYRQATHGGVYKENEQNFISKLIDDTPTKFFNNIRVLPQLNALAGEHNARMTNIVKSHGFESYPGIKSKSNQIVPGVTHEIKNFNGKDYYIPIKSK